ncbi:hypothetical protein C2S52_000671 [Perilla frutescens var. hirtella]|nr:hypothetical protein C2S51_007760 [Perilla frutescens var. frutescens]KAH6800207.1 hypothetical protein C2S52_000671 [Perilla frutescens var. hirtella]
MQVGSIIKHLQNPSSSMQALSIFKHLQVHIRAYASQLHLRTSSSFKYASRLHLQTSSSFKYASRLNHRSSSSSIFKLQVCKSLSSSSFEYKTDGEESDLSWVQSLVKESPSEMMNKPTAPSSGVAPSRTNRDYSNLGLQRRQLCFEGDEGGSHTQHKVSCCNSAESRKKTCRGEDKSRKEALKNLHWSNSLSSGNHAAFIPLGLAFFLSSRCLIGSDQGARAQAEKQGGAAGAAEGSEDGACVTSGGESYQRRSQQAFKNQGGEVVDRAGAHRHFSEAEVSSA